MFTNWLLYDINICPFLNLTKAERTQKWGKTQLTYFSRPQLQFFFYFVWTYDSHKFRRGKQMERPVIGFWRLSFVRTRPTSPTRKTHGDTSPVETEDAVEYSPWHYFVAESQLFLWPRVLTNFNFGPQTSHPYRKTMTQICQNWDLRWARVQVYSNIKWDTPWSCGFKAPTNNLYDLGPRPKDQSTLLSGEATCFG